MYYLDTDTVSLMERENAAVLQRVLQHDPSEVCITVITLYEQMDGRFKQIARAQTADELATAYRQFADTFQRLRDLPVVNFDQPAIIRFESLLKMKLNVGKNDLRIAAVALEAGATVVTRNKRDFARVPDLLIEDWTQEN